MFTGKSVQDLLMEYVSVGVALSICQKSEKAGMIEEIRHSFAQERDEEPGDPAAGMVPGFIAGNLAPEFYNQGVDNAGRGDVKDALGERRGVRVG